MLRRLFALLALVTGLAAGAPAHAGLAAALDARLEMAQQAESGNRQAAGACVEGDRQQKARGERAAPCKPRRTITIVIPTVQLGSDRAAE